MAKIYSINNTHDTPKLDECRPFEIKEKETTKELSSVYNEVLKILKEAFSLVDITQIIKK